MSSTVTGQATRTPWGTSKTLWHVTDWTTVTSFMKLSSSDYVIATALHEIHERCRRLLHRKIGLGRLTARTS